MANFFNVYVFGPFLAHFPNFWRKKIFSGKYGSVTHNFIWFLVSHQNLEKTKDTIPRKRPDRQKDGRREGLTDPIS